MKNLDKIKKLEAVVNSKHVSEDIKTKAKDAIEKLKSSGSSGTPIVNKKNNQSRVDWEGDVIDKMSEIGNMTTSDAQGIFDIQGPVVEKAFKKKYSPEKAAKEIIDASTVIEDKKPKGMKALLADDPKKSDEPSCDELIERHRKRKEASKKASKKKPSDSGDIIAKAAERAKKRISKNGKKLTDKEESKIEKAIDDLFSSIKSDKELIKNIIKRLQKLL
jgi:hypothetical protein